MRFARTNRFRSTRTHNDVPLNINIQRTPIKCVLCLIIIFNRIIVVRCVSIGSATLYVLHNCFLAGCWSSIERINFRTRSVLLLTMCRRCERFCLLFQFSHCTKMFQALHPRPSNIRCLPKTENIPLPIAWLISEELSKSFILSALRSLITHVCLNGHPFSCVHLHARWFLSGGNLMASPITNTHFNYHIRVNGR